MTQQGFLRLATDPRVLKSEAVTLPEAWGMYDGILRDRRISFSEEPAGVETIWQRHIRTIGDGLHTQGLERRVPWLHLLGRLAYEIRHNFDKGFTKYANVKCAILS